ncbi:SRPBCC family protein [Leucobacter massiliensis]|uniref:Cyclase n=1 Tax=Leucobacter massiliensis TaxID=1686285 RepID=A0A2S9QK92_9MICO|nr:SRPBCC family protein [Leucobacter massiliensis]PRI10011.1 cyclase [Leucobacter massiliensis]
MHTVTSDIDVNAPVRTVYDQWTQFEDFPAFMSGVEEVRQLDDTTTHWKVKVGGVEREFQARITEQLPDERIAWRSLSGPQHAGVVTFHRLSDDQTRVRLQLEWEPEGFVEHVGAALHIDNARVGEDLREFARLLESNGFATGAWRGSVDRPDSTGGAPAAP